MKKTEVELESRVIQGAHGVAAEEDHINTPKIVGTGILALAIFLVGCIWAIRIMSVSQHEFAPEGSAPVPAAMGQYEIGIVNQRVFEQDVHAEEKIGSQQAALAEGLGDDAKQGAVHPKLEAAMQQVIAHEQQARQQQPAPTPAPAPQGAGTKPGAQTPPAAGQKPGAQTPPAAGQKPGAQPPQK